MCRCNARGRILNIQISIFKYQSIVQELLQRHAVEYAAAQSADLLLTYDSSNTKCLTSDSLEKQKAFQFVYKNTLSLGSLCGP
jgi:hypothetical protein